MNATAHFDSFFALGAIGRHAYPGGTTSLALFACCIVVSALCSAGETAVFSLSRLHLDHIRHQGKRRTGALQSALRNPATSLFGLLGLNVVARIGATLAALATTHALFPENPREALLLGCGIAAGAILLFTVIIPEALAGAFPAPIAAFMARPLTLLASVVSPLIRTSPRPTTEGRRNKVESRDFTTRLVSEHQLRALIEMGDIEGLLTERERSIIDGVLEFGDATADEIMLPRPAIEALPDTLTQQELLEALRHTRHSRIPLYHETIDRITGVIHAKAALLNPSTPYQQFVREPLFIPEKRALTDLLSDFQRGRMHLAVVVDEYGGTSGIVTLADLLQEVIGVFEEEEDEVSPIREVEPGKWVVQGTCEVSEFNAATGSKIPDSMNRTIGGFVTALLGRFPRQQESVSFDNLTFTALRMENTRVRLLRVQLRSENDLAQDEQKKLKNAAEDQR